MGRAYIAIEADGETDGHGEAVAEGDVIGSTSSITYGHGVGKIPPAYVKPHAALEGTALEIVVMNEPRPAMVLGEAAYDLVPRADA